MRRLLAVDATCAPMRPVLGAGAEQVVEDVDDGVDAALRPTVVVLQSRVEGAYSNRDVGVTGVT